MSFSTSMKEALRQLPSVDKLLREPSLQALASEYGHDSVVESARTVLDQVREDVLSGLPLIQHEELADSIADRVRAAIHPTLQPIINATGVIIHTNLGRAPLSAAAMAAMQEVGASYTNLEYDLDAGQRGSRYTHATHLLRRLTGAEAALVVNNNAGATLLILSALARGREVIVSRGQLVEIGGGFRIPEVMAQSGARLVEVGTTNKTYLRDYAGAITQDTAMLMRVHSSNFRVTGFTHQTSIEELVSLGRERGLRVLDDLGSGSLLDTTPYGLMPEPTVQTSIEAGADLVCFSGDKLLGGPQAGVIVGKAEPIEQIRGFPMTRALRVDKTTLAGLQATLLSYVRGKATEEIPVWRMLSTPQVGIEERAQVWADHLRAHGANVTVEPAESTVGGGSLPGETLPTLVLAIVVDSPDALAEALRSSDPPIIARIEDDKLLLDPRTVLPAQDQQLLDALTTAIAQQERTG
ncbi:MAG: L-seryl-tRNA(Sec) selenium transferase [Anaerolineales bacterium]|nr:L-seryl-tRNA(Sec) selenium transferase [Anaerolineales bacterium]